MSSSNARDVALPESTVDQPAGDELSAEELEGQAALELPVRRAMSLLGGSALSGGGLLGGATPTASPTTLPAGSTPDATTTAANTTSLAQEAGTPPPDATAQPYSPTQTSSASS